MTSISTAPESIADIDLSQIPDQKYFNTDREWREEFIYFLMVDRFHDDKLRTSVSQSERSTGFNDKDKLGKFCGGTLNGITNHLDYIQNLGCTALWLSPIFENNPDSDKYHGYAIQNYLNIDPRFGTKADLIKLVDEAHQRDMRVFLDVVLNHSGDNWYYPNNVPYYYDGKGTQFELGGFRRDNRPLPTELRNPNFYHRRGEIRNWDNYPETQIGDFFSLKDFNNGEDADGLELQEILIVAHCYWMREADIDGFRLDAVKHLGERPVARFCSAIREYAYRLGKRWFFLFGELVAGDDTILGYIGPNTPVSNSDRNIYYGLTSVLDFPLYWTLPNVVKGFTSPQALVQRYEASLGRSLSRGELSRYLVTFLDNHDQIGQEPKRRFGTQTPPQQIVAGIGLLLTLLGTPCIYYGTEQGFSGIGSDHDIREAMFDPGDPSNNFLNQNCDIYKGIATIAKIFKEVEALRFGRIYFREISDNGRDFGLPLGHPCTLAFSRILTSEEVLIAYNTSAQNARNDYIVVDSKYQAKRTKMKFLYGGTGDVNIHSHPDPNNSTRFVQLNLLPNQLAILM